MKVINIFPRIVKQNAKEYIDGQNESIYMQNIKILGGTLVDQSKLLFIYNDRGEITAQQKLLSHICLFDINKQSIIQTQEIQFKDSAQIFLTNVIYNAYQVYEYQSMCILFEIDNESTEVINQVIEDIRKNNIIIFTSQQTILFDLNQRSITNKTDLLINSAANITTNLSEEEFVGFELGEQEVYFIHFSVTNNKIIIKSRDKTSELDHCYSFNMNNQIQVSFNLGTYYTHNIKSVYFTHGYYQDQCNSLSCFNIHSQAVHYLYPTVAPVIAFSRLENYLLYDQETGNYYDIIAFADAAGFLTITLGGTSVWERRLITVQTNMQVKSIQFNVIQCQEKNDNTFPLIYVNYFLQKENKMNLKQVQNEGTIVVLGSTEACKSSQQLSVDGFSIINFRFSDLLQTLKGEYFQLDRSDDFSYVDYQIPELPNYVSSPQTSDQYSLSDPDFVAEDIEETEESMESKSNKIETTNQQQEIQSKEMLFMKRIGPLFRFTSNPEILNYLKQQNNALKDKAQRQSIWNNNSVNQTLQTQSSENIKKLQKELTKEQINENVNVKIENDNNLQQVKNEQSQNNIQANMVIDQPTTQNEAKETIQKPRKPRQNKIKIQEVQQQPQQQQQQENNNQLVKTQQNKTINYTHYLSNGEIIKIVQIYKQLPSLLLSYQSFSAILSSNPIQIIFLKLQLQEQKSQKSKAKLSLEQQKDACIPHILILNSDQCQLYNCETGCIFQSISNILNNNICIILSNTQDLYPMTNANFIEIDNPIQVADIYIATNKAIINLTSRQEVPFPAQRLQYIETFIQSPGWMATHTDELFYFINKCTIVVLFRQQNDYALETIINLQHLLLCCEDIDKLKLYFEQSKIPEHIKQYAMNNLYQIIQQQDHMELNPGITDIEKLKNTKIFLMFQQIIQLAVQEFYLFNNVQFIQIALKQLYHDLEGYDEEANKLIRQYLLNFMDTHQGLSVIEKQIKQFFSQRKNHE